MQLPAVEPIAHAGKDHGDEAEGRWVVVRERIVPDSSVHEVVWIPRALGAELPYGPVLAMSLVEERDEMVERIAVGSLWVCL